MQKLTAKEVVKRFYDEVCKEKYPGLTLQQIRDICYNPFKVLRVAIWQEWLPTFRFKALGLFRPNIWSILNLLGKIDLLLKEEKITQERYDYLKRVLVDYCKKEIFRLKNEYKDNIAAGKKRRVNWYYYRNVIRRIQFYVDKAEKKECYIKECTGLFTGNNALSPLLQSDMEFFNTQTHQRTNRDANTFYENRVL